MLPKFKVVNVLHSTDDDDENIIRITIRTPGVCFEVTFLAKNLVASSDLLTSHNDSLYILRNCEDEKKEAEIHRLVDPFKTLMAQLAAGYPHPGDSLFYYLYPPRIVIEAHADNNSEIQQISKGETPRQLICPPGQYLDSEDSWISMKHLTSDDIQLVQKPGWHSSLQEPYTVIVDSTVCYFKSEMKQMERSKPWVYTQIEDAFRDKKLRADMRICRLHSVVIDEDSKTLQHYKEVSEEQLSQWGEDKMLKPTLPYRMVAILLTFIKNQGTLFMMARKSQDPDQLVSWAKELEGLVNELHGADLVWGDAKPENVLVDLENKLWLIDFDGSYTADWVDAENKESQKGDLQGVARTKKWLEELKEKIS